MSWVRLDDVDCGLELNRLSVNSTNELGMDVDYAAGWRSGLWVGEPDVDCELDLDVEVGWRIGIREEATSILLWRAWRLRW